MEGISVLHNQTNNKRYVQIDLEVLENHQEEIEDLFDAIIAESRKDDTTISLEELKEKLTAAGKL